MSKDTYNGYTNYETWLVCLYINNDEDMQRYYREGVRTFDSKVGARDWLEDSFSGLLEREDSLSGMWLDLVQNALSNVNWYEIAKILLEE